MRYTHAVKGDQWPSEHSVGDDGVHQLTNHADISHPSYFLQRSFTADNGTLFFTSYRDRKQPQLFKLGFPDGRIRQLTGGDPIHPFSPAILPGNGDIVVVRGGSIGIVDPNRLIEWPVVVFDNAQLGECSFSPDGEWLTAAIKRNGAPGLAVGKQDGSQWRIIPFPRTVIHPQFHPLEPEWIEFAADPAPRMYRVKRDGTGLECLYEHSNDEFVVHETFLGGTGDLVFTVWPHSLKRMHWQTREITSIAELNAWHIAPNRAGTQVLCDTNHPDRGLFLIDVASGEARPICLSGASNQGSQWRKSRYALATDFAAARSEATQNLSWMEGVDTVYGPQWTHPHPSFSPDETLVAFASDRTGTTQVYVADIPALQS